VNDDARFDLDPQPVSTPSALAGLAWCYVLLAVLVGIAVAPALVILVWRAAL
jgi:hypothetical protein